MYQICRNRLRSAHSFGPTAQRQADWCNLRSSSQSPSSGAPIRTGSSSPKSSRTSKQKCRNRLRAAHSFGRERQQGHRHRRQFCRVAIAFERRTRSDLTSTLLILEKLESQSPSSGALIRTWLAPASANVATVCRNRLRAAHSFGLCGDITRGIRVHASQSPSNGALIRTQSIFQVLNRVCFLIRRNRLRAAHSFGPLHGLDGDSGPIGRNRLRAAHSIRTEERSGRTLTGFRGSRNRLRAAHSFGPEVISMALCHREGSQSPSSGAPIRTLAILTH